MTRKYLSRSATSTFFLFMLGFPLLLWLYSIGMEFNNRLPENKQTKKIYYKSTLVYPLIYMIVGPVYLISTGNMNSILPFHLLAMATIFVSLFLAAKSITKYEEEFNIKTSSTSEYFMLLWFFPIGVWTVQPRLNKFILDQ